MVKRLPGGHVVNDLGPPTLFPWGIYMNDRRNQRRKPAALLTFLSLLLATVFSAVMIPAASAAEIPVKNLTGTVLAPGGGPIDGNVKETQAFELHLKFDLDNNVMPGDQFTIAFPQEVQAYTSPIPVTILGPNKEEVGTCAISGGSVTCTLGEFVRGRDGFTGFTFFFGMTAVDDNDGEETLPLTINDGAPVLIDLPGEGGIIGFGGYPFPTGVKKEGWVYLNDTGQLEWRVWLLVGANQTTITLTDDLKDGMTWVQEPNSYYADYWTTTAENWNEDNPWDGTDKRIPAASQTWTPKADKSGFTLTLAVPTGATAILLSYRSQLPPGVVFNQVFHNSLSGSYTVNNATATYQYRAGASGNGNEIPDLVIKKAVVGTAPTGATFEVQVACVDAQGLKLANSPFMRTISVETPATVLDIPAGTKCTVTETKTGGAVAVSYVPARGEITMSGTTVPVEVTVTNDFTPVVPQVGSFSVTKAVTGTKAAVDLVGAKPFTVSYTVSNPPSAGLLTVANGETKTVGNLPVGSVVTLAEIVPSQPGVTFGTPTFTVNGVPVTQITIGADTPVAVTLTNPVTVPPTGGFTVTKAVTGPQAAVDLVKDVPFLVNVSVGGIVYMEPMAITNGASFTLTDLPAGAVVSLSEVKPSAPGVVFGTPVFTVNGKAVTSFKVESDVIVSVTLTNPVELATSPSTAPSTTPPTTKPPGVTPTKPPGNRLPETGVGGLGFTAAGAVVLLLGGAVVLAGRRRNNSA